jgi:D-mannonate dehydratase
MMLKGSIVKCLKMNKLDVRLLCYNFIATGWYRANKIIKEEEAQQ